MPDIKEWLRAAAGTLDPGEVVKPANLHYLEAMNALQINEPAMDWGCKFNPLGQFDPGACLSAEQLCWVMDEMAARELAWHRGGTMAQTVFMSLHYHNAIDIFPREPPDHERYAETYTACAALRAYVLGYAKCIEVAYYTLLDHGSGTARDGEDIWLDPYGIPLETTEAADEVTLFIRNVVDWLQARVDMTDEWWQQVLLRLNFRNEWLEAIQSSPVQVLAPGKPSTATVPWAFDDVAAFLRQNMPQGILELPTHEDMWSGMRGALEQLSQTPKRARLPLADLEQELLSLPEMLPIVRTLFKAGAVDTQPRELIVDDWLSIATGQERQVLARVDASISNAADRRSFALWRDIISGNLLLTLTAPLSSAARRRRSFQHLARTWSEQAAAAARLQGRGYVEMAPLVAALIARALECELEATLLAPCIHILGKGEQRAHWWWVLNVARERATAPVCETWQTVWARAWVAVASAMVLLFTLVPTGAPEPSTVQFVCRFKIPLGGAHPVPPLPSAWEAARKALDELDRVAARKLAKEWLEDADRLFADLGHSRLDTRSVREDITALLAALGEEQLAWEAVRGRIGERRIPRLKVA